MNKIPVFYRQEMNAVVSELTFSPSAGKPQKVVGRWQERYPDLIDVRPFARASLGELTTAHDPDFVVGILKTNLPNGFGTFDKSVAESLRYTVGSMVSAGKHASSNGGFACSPTSGFHHAGHAFSGGYCTLNGLAVAAGVLAEAGHSVGILDGDAHYGNGTDDILSGPLRNLGIKHWTWGKDHPCGENADSDVVDWYSKACADLKDCDVVLYQAGADPHIRDPLGGQLSSKMMQVRDIIVFSTLKNVAWNLAGGYGDMERVLDLHSATLKTASHIANGGTY